MPALHDKEQADAYVIPDYDPAMRRWRKLWWLVPGCMALAAAVSYSQHGELIDAIVAAFENLIPGVILVVLIFIPLIRHFHKLEQAKIDKHNFQWYCASFPSHAPGDKRQLRCRHCNSERMRTENQLRHSQLRIHSCGQCGETLYYSREKR